MRQEENGTLWGIVEQVNKYTYKDRKSISYLIALDGVEENCVPRIYKNKGFKIPTEEEIAGYLSSKKPFYSIIGNGPILMIKYDSKEGVSVRAFNLWYGDLEGKSGVGYLKEVMLDEELQKHLYRLCGLGDNQIFNREMFLRKRCGYEER